jgi:hypothetical protein
MVPSQVFGLIPMLSAIPHEVDLERKYGYKSYKKNTDTDSTFNGVSVSTSQ